MKDIAETRDVPVIFLSAYGQDRLVARGLRHGGRRLRGQALLADGAVGQEIRAVLRRREAPKPSEPYVLGDLSIDYDERQVTIAGLPVELTAREYETLAGLSANAGRVLSYEHLPDADRHQQHPPQAGRRFRNPHLHLHRSPRRLPDAEEGDAERRGGLTMDVLDGVVAAALAVATGVIAASLVAVVSSIKSRLRRRAALRYIGGEMSDFQSELASARGVPDAPPRPITREELQAAYWRAHIAHMRAVIAAHLPILSEDQYVTLIGIIDSRVRNRDHDRRGAQTPVRRVGIRWVLRSATGATVATDVVVIAGPSNRRLGCPSCTHATPTSMAS